MTLFGEAGARRSAAWASRYGPWALVTGASSGLGRAFALQLARRNMDLILTARRREQLEEVARQCESEGVSVIVVPIDLRDPRAAQRLQQEIADRDVGLLVNNAGVGLMGDVAELDLQAQIDMILVNTVALLAMTHALLPPMLKRGRGGIVTVASIAGFHGNPLMTTYGSTKAFALCFSEGLASEISGRGVDVLTLCPGITRTDFLEASGMSVPKGFAASEPDRVVREALSRLGRRRILVTGFDNRLFVQLHRLLPRAAMTRIKLLLAHKFRAVKPDHVSLAGSRAGR